MIATVRRPPAGAGADGRVRVGGDPARHRVALAPERRVRAHVAIEDGEHLARQLLVAVAEDRREDLVPALGPDAPRVLGDQGADLLERVAGIGGEPGADVLPRRRGGPLLARAALAPAANHG